MEFVLKSKYAPTGDQPQAIDQLVDGVNQGLRTQVLKGVTGSGKTFTMANIIARVGRPTLVVAHNKTLAAQLCNELREFFPENRVEYFVSYYDYYQPESYIPSTDTYIEKELDINEEKVRLRQHCRYFLETIDSEPNPGKKLGFIAQEMGREINTTGSKANHTEIQKLVVKMKDELEKIKEQSLNIL